MEKHDLDFISSQFESVGKQFDSFTTLINSQFKGVNDRLDKINGRVGKTEDEIQMALIERSANRQKQEDYFNQIANMHKEIQEIDLKERNHVTVCPVLPKLPELDKRIRVLEDSNLATISKSSLVKSAIGMLAILITIMVGSLKINETLRVNETKKLMLQNDSIIINQIKIMYKIQNAK